MTIEQSWQTIAKWATTNAPGLLSSLRRGATQGDIEAAEQRLGLRLPDDLRASLRLYDGQDLQGPSLFESSYLFPLTHVVAEWETWRDQSPGIESEPGAVQAGIRPEWWNPAWIPIAGNRVRDYEAIDLAPASGGTQGQVISMSCDDPARALIAPSFGRWLEGLAAGLTSGRLIYLERYGGVIADSPELDKTVVAPKKKSLFRRLFG